MDGADVLPLILGLGMCVIMPIVIVWIVMRVKDNATKEKFALLHKAVEHGIEIDPELLVDRKAADNLKMRLLSKLQWGIIFTVIGIVSVVYMFFDLAMDKTLISLIACVLLAMGLGFLVTYFVGRKDLHHEISLEEKEAEKRSSK